MLVPYRYSQGGTDPTKLLHIADAEKYNRFQIKKASTPMGMAISDSANNAAFAGIMTCFAAWTTWIFAGPMHEFIFMFGHGYYYATTISFGLISIGFGLVCLYHIAKLVEANLIKYADVTNMFTCWSYYQPLAKLVEELGDDWNVAAALMSYKSDLCGALSHILTCYINDVRDAANNDDEASTEFLTKQAVQTVRHLLNGEIRRQQVTPACHPAT